MRILALLTVAALALPAHAYQSVNPVGDIQDTPGGSSPLYVDDDTVLCFGDGLDYCWRYDSSNTQLELVSTDCDGAGADCDALSIDDGTDDFDFPGDLVCVGTVSGGTITDGTATLTGDTLTAGTITDGTATLTGGDLSGAGTVTATTLTDGTMSSTAGAISGATTIDATVDVEVSAATGGLVKVTDTTTPGDAAGAGAFEFHAESDASNDRTMCSLTLDVISAADTAEYADIVVSCYINGSLTEVARMDSSLGYWDISQKIRTDTILMTGSVPNYGFARMNNSASLSWQSLPAGSPKYMSLNSDEEFYFSAPIDTDGPDPGIKIRDNTSPGVAGGGGHLTYMARDDATNYHDMVSIQGYVTDASTGAEYAEGRAYATTNGTDATLYLTWGNDAVTLSKPLVHDTQVAASPAAPRTCDATALGTVQVVNDSDDGAGTEVCYCGMTDDSTYDWLDMSDNTACSHY